MYFWVYTSYLYLLYHKYIEYCLPYSKYLLKEYMNEFKKIVKDYRLYKRE